MRRLKLWLLAVGLLAGALLLGTLGTPRVALADPADPAETLPTGAFVARVYYEKIADLEGLARYDVWEFNNLQERYVLVSMDRAIFREIQRAGWRIEVDQEATARLNAAGIDTFYGGYRTVDELYTELASTNAANPTLTEVVDYGDSYCKTQGGCVTLGGDAMPGYDLRALRITNEAIGGDKPTFFLVANIHAREITTPELAMRFIDWLIDGYGTNADATWLVDFHEIWVVPTINPDGHDIVELGTEPPYNTNPFTQRKNANRSNGCNAWPPSSFSQYGIDLNRNHTFAWNTGGSSGLPCDLTYRGPSAGSENEVAQLEALVRTHIPDQRGPGNNDAAPLNTTGLLITLHSYSELVLWPWGNTTQSAPNRAGLEAIGDKFATYNGYTSCQPSQCLYLTSGTTDDWAYGELGIPAFTFEVGNEFMPPYSQVDSIQWPENRPAFIYAAKIARTPYRTAFGPDALSVAASVSGGTVTLTAQIRDVQNGNQTVRRAAYTVDQPLGGLTNARPMSASDGNFNSPTENVQATVTGLSSGRHTLFVYGQDAGGNIGPATAVFVTVP